MTLTCKKMTNNDPGFYSYFGNYLANRKVMAEIGYQVYDDAGKEWVFIENEGVLVAFCYIWKRGSRYEMGSCWVNPGIKSKRILGRMVRVACKDVDMDVTCTTGNKVLQEVLGSEGFKIGKETRNFKEYRLEK